MRYAIVESGGKQYKAVEGSTIEVDRLPDDEGKHIQLKRVLLMADGTDFQIGAPLLAGIEVRATVVEHMRGPKLTHFKYRPKKRIRVKGGHRQQYTRLLVESIGSKGESRTAVAEPNAVAEVVAPSKPRVKSPARKTAAKKTADKKQAAPSKPATKKTSK
jgi:large subunit ribosomal protein L21